MKLITKLLNYFSTETFHYDDTCIVNYSMICNPYFHIKYVFKDLLEFLKNLGSNEIYSQITEFFSFQSSDIYTMELPDEKFIKKSVKKRTLLLHAVQNVILFR